jgi:hypothetical protein
VTGQSSDAIDGSALYGGWRVISTVVTVEGEGEQVIPSTGYLLFTPEHRIAAIVARPGRKPARNEAEELALARSLMAYTGRFDLRQDHYVAHLDMSSTQLALDEPQIRYFTIDGDRLTISMPMKPSTVRPGVRDSTVLTAVRER